MSCSPCTAYYVVMAIFFFFKQKTAYEMRISDWSSDVCSSDLPDQLDDALQRLDRIALGAEVERNQIGLAVRKHRDRRRRTAEMKIGRASCRERVCQYV